MKAIFVSVLFAFLSVSQAVCADVDIPEVHYPVVPVIAGRDCNVAAEICIVSDGERNGKLDYIDVRLDGIPTDAVRSLELMYSGTMSVVRSRTTSYVLVDNARKSGGGQSIWCDSDFVEKVGSAPAADKARIHCEKALVSGRNYFYVSISIDPEKVMDISIPFVVEVTGISVNGNERKYSVSGNPRHRLGISVRQAGDDGVTAYRIPGLVTALDGSLIAVYDIRYDSSLDLQNNIDVGVSRSSDGGLSWQYLGPVLDMGTYGGLPQAQNGVGDPSVLVDEMTGEIFIAGLWTHGIGVDRAWTGVGQGLTPEETGQILLTSSRDNGLTWSDPVNITPQVKRPEWYLTLQGPGRGISMNDGTLVFPMQHIGTDRVPCAGIMYSQDHGKTWKTHNYAKTNTTEAQVVEVSPGELMLNMRDNRKTGRAVAVTPDMGETWTEHRSSGALREPVCMASIIKVPADKNRYGKDILLFSNPDTTKGRNHMSIKASLDGGNTWLPENSLLLDEEENWGYSCMSMIDEETVGILYECSTVQLVFQAVKLSDIISSPEPFAAETLPSASAEDTSGYGMGVSAAFCGILGSVPVMAGGANFPDVPASENGRKSFYDDIFVLSGNRWLHAGTLPETLAYGGSAVCGNRLYVIGGNGGYGTTGSVYSLSVKDGKADVRQENSLPFPIEQAGYASENNKIYVVGGISGTSASRKVLAGTVGRSRGIQWEEIAVLPENLVQPVAYAYGGSLYVWGGYDPESGLCSGKGYRLDLRRKEWSSVSAVPDGGTFTGAVSIALPCGMAAVVGGVCPEIFERGLSGKYKDYLTLPPANYRFNDRLWIYSPRTDTWDCAGRSGRLALAGAAAAADNGYIYVFGGEIKPRVRTPENLRIEIRNIVK